MTNSLSVMLACASMLPIQASAAVGAAPAQGQESLDRVADLARTAQVSGSLERANQSMNRGYDLAAAGERPVDPADATQQQPPQLNPAPPEQGIHYAQVPTITDDKEKDDSAAKAAAKKKVDLQRAVVGGIGGALVLAVFGFIFGGPIGALAMGAIGFGVMAGITYMNNNPIGG